jgi:hypothetical protein
LSDGVLTTDDFDILGVSVLVAMEGNGFLLRVLFIGLLAEPLVGQPLGFCLDGVGLQSERIRIHIWV